MFEDSKNQKINADNDNHEKWTAADAIGLQFLWEAHEKYKDAPKIDRYSEEFLSSLSFNTCHWEFLCTTVALTDLIDQYRAAADAATRDTVAEKYRDEYELRKNLVRRMSKLSSEPGFKG